MIFHSIKPEQIKILEEIFAYLTKDGWVIPDWIKLLENP